MRRGAQCEAQRGALQQQIDEDENDRGHADDSEVLEARRGSEDVDRLHRERARERVLEVTEEESREAVDERRETERDDHQREHRRALDRPDHDALDHDAADERDRDRDGQRDPVAHAAPEQREREECREHRHLALREVHEAHRVVDEDEREGEARVDAARGDAAQHLLQ